MSKGGGWISRAPFHGPTAGVVRVDGAVLLVDGRGGSWIWVREDAGQARWCHESQGSLSSSYVDDSVVQPQVRTAEVGDGFHIRGLQDHSEYVDGEVHPVRSHGT